MRLTSPLLWLLFAGVVGAAGAIALKACGVAAALELPFGWNFCPADPVGLSQAAAQGEELMRERARLERALADKQLECAAVPPPDPPPLELPREAGVPKPQQTAARRPPPPPPPKVDFDAERWRNKDLSVLEGCWRLGRDAPMARYESDGTLVESGCTQNAGRLCFDRSGNGVNEERTFCPSGMTFDCRAPLTARFANDGSIEAYQPDAPFGCNNGQNRLSWRRLTCRRVDDTKAICNRTDRVGTQVIEFRR
jgi:hypothetical protein